MIPSVSRIIRQGSFLPLPSGGRRSVSTVILLRHGQSQWNGPKARFTGWCDIPLTVRGRVEAVFAGQLMRSRGFEAGKICVAFASDLQRSHETCELALASMAGHEQETWHSSRIRRDWRLNERHYGAVQGFYKNDPDLKADFGEELLRNWRRSMHGKPPRMGKMHKYYQPPPAPQTESLADCQKRVVECWENSMAPALFEEEDLPYPPDQRTILVAAHANTIRSLMAYFDDVPEDLVQNMYIPNSVPILYRFKTSTRQPISVKLESNHGGSHARWMLGPQNAQAIRTALNEGGTLTRAIFDAMGPGRDLYITGRDLEAGVRELMKDEGAPIDWVVLGVAKEICRNIAPDEKIHYSEFERRTQKVLSDFTIKNLNPLDIVNKETNGSY
jgi:2,3-bisphosphoglycerate-dependent phosphoglycerate mutase